MKIAFVNESHIFTAITLANFHQQYIEYKKLILTLFYQRSDTTSTTSSTPQNLHLDGTDNDENRWPGIAAPSYKDKPDWVHVLPVPDLTRYDIFINLE